MVARGLLIFVLGLASYGSFSVELATLKNGRFTGKRFKEELSILGHGAKMVKSSGEYRRKFLEHLIDNELLAQEAAKAKMYESKNFKLRLAAAKRDILANQYVQSFIDKETTDKALKAYFEANREKFSDKEVRASHILFKDADEKKAQAVLKIALSGADFGTLAKKHSTGPSGPKGGDLNFFKKGRMVAEFDAAAFSTAIGKVHPKLVKTMFGWHIIKVTDIRGGGAVLFEDKKQQIKRKRSKEIREDLLTKLRRENEVIIDEKAVMDLSL